MTLQSVTVTLHYVSAVWYSANGGDTDCHVEISINVSVIKCNGDTD